jgi:hypothetical protein
MENEHRPNKVVCKDLGATKIRFSPAMATRVADASGIIPVGIALVRPIIMASGKRNAKAS